MSTFCCHPAELGGVRERGNREDLIRGCFPCDRILASVETYTAICLERLNKQCN